MTLMKKWLMILYLACMGIGVFAACGSGVGETQANIVTEANEANTASDMKEKTVMKVKVQDKDHTIVYELNDSAAAKSLYAQLPLKIEVENFSDNEKVFYPPQKLSTKDTPLASDGQGVLAYYKPWGDVVMFYAPFSGNGSLYELGKAVEGAKYIGKLDGTIQVTAE